ncbi:MAG TPA: cohesin domain-containing protein, partial [Pseudobacteroides sp.]|uniref:cohesin domain-containing protein n=1 Tax=Pseudobacteroides sp. TaxID=1968840 RepID=UPI002F9208E2
MRTKRLMAVLLTTLLLLGSIFSNVSLAATAPSISLDLDKTTASVGSIIKATVNINGISNFAGYQACLKYDPSVLQPVYSDGTAYDSSSTPELGTLLQKRYSPTEMASNELTQGLLNFGRTYMNLDGYKSSGVGENTGSIAEIYFKVLKTTPTTITFTDSAALKNAVTGTMIFDWSGAQLTNYSVAQAPSINGSVASSTPTPTKASPTTASPTAVPSPSPITGSGVVASLDKTTAAIGDIVTYTISVKDIAGFAGYQANVKFDPSVLQPVYSATEPYDNSSAPEYGTLLQKRYSPTDMAANDITKGTLTFGRTYMNLDGYKNSGAAETTGSIAIIKFKVLK